eukprot:TRINITY_DN1119_c0_g1_i1.p1 TRINITY_DN1119_c0_g1~~TRINITY_DN1119_c0_g1_i1.p1  ORF type:complete len:127 (-),score=45.99 TRINITY_DN1119_c0_g1_i1:111-491(-)
MDQLPGALSFNNIGDSYSLREAMTKIRGEAKNEVHPVQIIQKNLLLNQFKLEQFTTTAVFGSHMALRREMEQKLVSQICLPGRNLSRVSLDALRGDECEFDLMDDFENSETDYNMYAHVERTLGLI